MASRKDNLRDDTRSLSADSGKCHRTINTPRNSNTFNNADEPQTNSSSHQMFVIRTLIVLGIICNIGLVLIFVFGHPSRLSSRRPWTPPLCRLPLPQTLVLSDPPGVPLLFASKLQVLPWEACHLSSPMLFSCHCHCKEGSLTSPDSSLCTLLEFFIVFRFTAFSLSVEVCLQCVCRRNGLVLVMVLSVPRRTSSPESSWTIGKWRQSAPAQVLSQCLLLCRIRLQSLTVPFSVWPLVVRF